MVTLHFSVRKNKYIIGLGQLFTHFFQLNCLVCQEQNIGEHLSACVLFV